MNLEDIRVGDILVVTGGCRPRDGDRRITYHFIEHGAVVEVMRKGENEVHVRPLDMASWTEEAGMLREDDTNYVYCQDLEPAPVPRCIEEVEAFLDA